MTMRRVRTRAALWATAGLGLLTACAGGDEPVATVLVDYEHDEFATQFIRYLPDQVQAHAGDRISFKQAWTGEPHTVTFGTAVTEVLEVTRPLIAEYGDRPESEVPPEVLEEYFAAEMSLPSWYGDGDADGGQDGEEGDDADGAPDGGEAPEEASDDGTDEAGGTDVPPLPQALAQPCLIGAGDQMPEDTAAPCAEQELPPFTGTETYYNSGIIPYEGPSGNTFEFTLADDIAPGEYGFYCAVHGSFQSGVLEVVPDEEPIRTPEENAQQLRQQVTDLLEPYELTFADALRGRYTYLGEDHTWNYAGLLREDGQDGIINEFVPRIIDAEVDEPIVWRMFGPHSISFDVPEYFPIVEFGEDGEVRSNEAVYEPAGGAPPLPELDGGPAPEPDDAEAADGEGDGGDGQDAGPPPEPEPIVVDGGTWDGSGFWSSGVLYSDLYVEYTLRISTPGTYRYACLIHPPMVGTVRVTE
jgi:plastocyanin